MSDQTKAVGFNGEGQAPEPSQPEEQKPAQQTDLTPDQEKLKDDISETVFRRLQGLQDRQTEHILKTLQAEKSPAPEPSKDAPAQEQPKGAPEVDLVTADARRMMDEAGIQINEDDPEAQSLLETRTPFAFLQAV